MASQDVSADDVINTVCWAMITDITSPTSLINDQISKYGVTVNTDTIANASKWNTGYDAVRKGLLSGIPETKNGLCLFAFAQEDGAAEIAFGAGPAATAWQQPFTILIAGTVVDGSQYRLSQDPARREGVITQLQAGVRRLFRATTFAPDGSFPITDLQGNSITLTDVHGNTTPVYGNQPRCGRGAYIQQPGQGQTAVSFQMTFTCYVYSFD